MNSNLSAGVATGANGRVVLCMPEQPRHCIVAIVPCNDIEASTAFYLRLGLTVHSDHGRYRILTDGQGWLLHLSSESPQGSVVPGRNPNGLYLYLEDVDGIAVRVSELSGGARPAHKAWGMYEFALSDPDGTLVRIGWPSRLVRGGRD
jgi:catechol 2,3-dioxygenase-like lactoylglutathione lyase family enzyme